MTYHDPMDGEGDLEALAWQQGNDEQPREHDEPVDKDGNALFCPHGTHRDAPCGDCTEDKYGPNDPFAPLEEQGT